MDLWYVMVCVVLIGICMYLNVMIHMVHIGRYLSVCVCIGMYLNLKVLICIGKYWYVWNVVHVLEHIHSY